MIKSPIPISNIGKEPGIFFILNIIPITNNIIPVVLSREVTAANTVVITMNAAVAASSCAPAQFAFTGWATEAASACTVSGSAITLTTTTAITAADTVNVAYTKGTGVANTQIQTSTGLVIT